MSGPSDRASSGPYADELARVLAALQAVRPLLERYASLDLSVDYKREDHPVTIADREADDLLREMLPRAGEGWLSEETADDERRLRDRRVWIVDPLDGTKEFIKRIPEWSISIGLVEDGVPVVGGILNPPANSLVLGAIGHGVTKNGVSARTKPWRGYREAEVLASRSEIGRGEWAPFERFGFKIRPVGSVAYKLAEVAAGTADATWTLVPKSEWDVAAGVALVRAAGGSVCLPDGSAPLFNQRQPRYPGLIAFSAESAAHFERALDEVRAR
ncbi:MAG: 3'(2'),5'-bisphosphate nucleotidase CysQ [Planctomycetes bacterium]|nr:3'(2'),5'-bisphosphate nucleotidase CysQ [Planctomycetota bacterium]